MTRYMKKKTKTVKAWAMVSRAGDLIGFTPYYTFHDVEDALDALDQEQQGHKATEHWRVVKCTITYHV